MYQPFLQV